MKRQAYKYRITSIKAGTLIQPQNFTHTLGGAIESAKAHADELPGCTTKIERLENEQWKLWSVGNWADAFSV